MAEVGVVGLGRFGGGLGLTRHLLEHGHEVRLFDRLDAGELAEPMAALEKHGNRVRLISGDHRIDDFSGLDTVYLNPAVPWQGGLADELRAAGVRLSSDLELWWSSWDRPVIGITGSNGKSTCWEILTRLLPDWAGGGNRGGTVFDLDPGCTGAILELSSFQLERLDPSVDVAIVTSFSDDHLDRHGSRESYREAKTRLTAGCSGLVVLGPLLADWPSPVARLDYGVDVAVEDMEIVFDDGLRLPLRDFPLHGPHNVVLAALAAAAARHVIGNDDELWVRFAGLHAAGLEPLPHRQNILVEEPWLVVDDSKSTTPESTLCALEAFAVPGQTHLIVGGAEKNLDITALAERCRDWKIRAYAIGEQAARWKQDDFVEDCGDLETAVSKIRDTVGEHAVVLLSPGTSSHDQFANFVERGNVFRDLVAEYFG